MIIQDIKQLTELTEAQHKARIVLFPMGLRLDIERMFTLPLGEEEWQEEWESIK